MDDIMTMNISIPADDEGYVLLKCEHCGTYFKAHPKDIQDDAILHIFCPSCGLVSESYLTDDVLELAQKMAINYAQDYIHNMLKGLEKNNKNNMIKFKVGKKPMRENEEPIHSGIEALEEVTLPCCKLMAKIKPLLKITGCYCPFCGVKNYGIEQN